MTNTVCARTGDPIYRAPGTGVVVADGSLARHTVNWGYTQPRILSVSWANLVPPDGLSLSKSAAGLCPEGVYPLTGTMSRAVGRCEEIEQ